MNVVMYKHSNIITKPFFNHTHITLHHTLSQKIHISINKVIFNVFYIIHFKF